VAYIVRETFFRPAEWRRQASTLPAELVNGLRLLLARHGQGCLFLPIRAMQYQAVVERREVIFVDSQGGYAHQDGVGGRLIRLAWQFPPASERLALDQPQPCEILHYDPEQPELHRRLVAELRPLVTTSLERQRRHPSGERCVIPFRPRAD
jgi:hypothetical protein